MLGGNWPQPGGCIFVDSRLLRPQLRRQRREMQCFPTVFVDGRHAVAAAEMDVEISAGRSRLLPLEGGHRRFDGG